MIAKNVKGEAFSQEVNLNSVEEDEEEEEMAPPQKKKKEAEEKAAEEKKLEEQKKVCLTFIGLFVSSDYLLLNLIGEKFSLGIFYL